MAFLKKEQAVQQLKVRIGNYDEFCALYYEKNSMNFDPILYVDMALDDCIAYFGTENIPNAVTVTTIVELAYAHFQQLNNNIPYGIKNVSYTEGSVSKSETYSTLQEINAIAENILKPYSRFRVVKVNASKHSKGMD